ncbi:MAG: translation initiation factor IF-2 [Lachnospiraceae bacterium]|nr:translation initiation factor IF-2 [Lachnospiraceae bacterium]
MAKIKIHELAKELGVPSKDVVAYLADNGSAVKSHMSNIEDKEIDMVKKKFGKASAPVKTEAPAPKATSEKAQTPVTKLAAPVAKPVTPVERPQGDRPMGQRPVQGDRPMGERRPQGDRPMGQRPVQGDRPMGERRPQGDRPMGQRPMQGDRPMGQRPQGDRPMGERRPMQGDRPMGERRPQGDRPMGERRPVQGDRPMGQRPQGDRPMGERRPMQGDRPMGQRPQGDRPMGERRPMQGDRPMGQRPQGDRPMGERRPQGDRPFNGERRPQGDRPFNGERRPQGDRPFNGERRPQGDRPFNGERRPQGDRPFSGERRPQGNQGGFGGKDRFFDKDMDKDAVQERRQPSKSYKGGEKSSIKSDLANELTKEQRAAAFSNRDRDKNREKKKDHEEDYDKLLKGKKDPNRKGAFIKPVAVKEEKKEEEIKTIVIPESLTLKELADKMKQQPSALVKKLFLAGKMVSINQEITFEEAEEIALEYDIIAEKEVKVNIVEELLKETEEDEATMVKRPPVVCVMGHVDHGKTSLLDAIRTTNVTAREAGGITQHIGAYMVEANGEKITFLDTPGHEAFTAMRMRGASSTDIAILVVAADDGVKPQTVEAINHAKAAGIEIIVAVNKIDKPAANVERVKQEMTEHGLVAEDWGGETIFVPVSAKSKEGIDKLLEMVLLTADVAEYKANPNRKARGIVIEAQLDKGRGPVATILVQKGTLRVGDTIAIGSAYGKVRAMMDDKGRRVKEATPSTPVEILGLNGVPDAGEVFLATESEKEARTIAEAYISQGKEKLLADTKARLSLDGLFSQIQAGNIKELNLIIKADVQGSVEAVKQSLLKLSNDEVAIRVIHGGVGLINESDVILASASNAIIIGFNTKPDNTAKDIAEREKVDVRLYRVIYNAIEDVEAAMKGMLDPEYEEKIIGHAEVRQTFKASGVGVIAGSYVTDGKIIRGCKARITREGTQIFDGPLASLKRFKDDVKEVATGYECGLVFEKFSDLQEFDQVELYMMVEVPRK